MRKATSIYDLLMSGLQATKYELVFNKTNLRVASWIIRVASYVCSFKKIKLRVASYELEFKGELHSNSWNLTFVNKLQFPLILRSFVFKASKNW